MGHADLYPFILSPAVIAKLRFVYDVVRGNTKPAAPPVPPRPEIARKGAALVHVGRQIRGRLRTFDRAAVRAHLE